MISPLSISILLISLLILITDPYISKKVLSSDDEAKKEISLESENDEDDLNEFNA